MHTREARGMSCAHLFRLVRHPIHLSQQLKEVTTLRRQGWRIAVLTNGLPAVQASKVAARFERVVN